ncbi:MAG: polysaccharide pyruvyl transferase family protein [Candidatus Bathyarchaeia archaeon]
MAKIVLIGGFGYSDIGDESQLTASLINLKRFLPNVEFLILSDNPKHTLLHHKLKADFSINFFLTRPFRKDDKVGHKIWNFLRLLRLNIYLRGLLFLFNAQLLKKNRSTILLDSLEKRLLDNLRSADLLFNVGGGNINSIFKIEFFSKCLTYLICRIFDKPVILSGQSIGPFYSRFDKFIARFSLNRVNVITLREKYSNEVLRNIGVTYPIIKITADDATLLPYESSEEIKKILKENICKCHLLVAMNARGLNLSQKINSHIDKKILALIADFLISKYDARVVFVPMQYMPGADDRVASFEVIKFMKYADRCHIITNEYDAKTLKSIIAQMDLAVGYRYHFIVYAVCSKVPCLGLYSDDYYSLKIRGILERVGQENYACNIKTTSITELTHMVEDLIAQKSIICKKLDKKIQELEELSLLSARYAAKFLKEKLDNMS